MAPGSTTVQTVGRAHLNDENLKYLAGQPDIPQPTAKQAITDCQHYRAALVLVLAAARAGDANEAGVQAAWQLGEKFEPTVTAVEPPAAATETSAAADTTVETVDMGEAAPSPASTEGSADEGAVADGSGTTSPEE